MNAYWIYWWNIHFYSDLNEEQVVILRENLHSLT